MNALGNIEIQSPRRLKVPDTSNPHFGKTLV